MIAQILWASPECALGLLAHADAALKRYRAAFAIDAGLTPPRQN